MQLGNNQGAKEDLVKYLEQMPAADDRKSIQEALDQF
jgi:regulator of sirC expression with transglutaminase-like and TPR domain